MFTIVSPVLIPNIQISVIYMEIANNSFLTLTYAPNKIKRTKYELLGRNEICEFKKHSLQF